MDDLTAALASSFTVSNDPNTTSAQHPRYALYKPKSSGSSQDRRRQKMLEIQKSHRFDFKSHARNLAEGSWTVPGEWEEVKSPSEEIEEDMELEVSWKKPCRSYKNQLMQSEWLVEVPEDFSTEWVTVLCPVAKRSLVVAARGKTCAYTKSGFCLHSFPSNLPGGNRKQSGKYNDYTILDCLFSETEGVYFVLDIMCWKSHPVYDSETEFRFYWLRSKIDETPELQEVSPSNPFKFVPLPNFPCTQEDISMAVSTANFEVDGLLFFHKRTHYTVGSTPLVVWLKPYMVPEIIGITIPDLLMEKKPQTYINYQTHIKEVKDYKQLNKNPPSMRKGSEKKIKPMEVERVILTRGQKKRQKKQDQYEAAGESMEVATETKHEPLPTEIGDCVTASPRKIHGRTLIDGAE